MKKTVRPNDDNPAMQGEGNYTAARGHRQSVKVFIDRSAVDQAARDAKPKSPKARRKKQKSRSGAANLNSAISGNSGRQVGPRKAWRAGVFDGQEISAPHPAHPQSGVQGTGGTGRLA